MVQKRWLFAFVCVGLGRGSAAAPAFCLAEGALLGPHTEPPHPNQ